MVQHGQHSRHHPGPVATRPVVIERGSLVTIASQTAMTEFACITPIPAQPFTIPASVLLSLAAESQTLYLCHFRFG